MTQNLSAAADAGEDRSSAAAGVLRRLGDLATSRQMQALADQAVVSGTSFVTLLVLGRWSEPTELGSYAVVVSLTTLAIFAADSLIIRPYTIRSRRPLGSPRQHAFGALVLTLSLAAITALAVLLAATALAVGGAWSIAAMALVLAVMVPSALLREFCRRIAFAKLRVGHALAVDAAVSAITIGGLAFLVAADRLDAAGALLVMTAANVLASMGWLALAQSWFDRLNVRILEITKQSWELGRWLLASQLAIQIQGYAAYWLAMLILGAGATGVYAATMSVVALSNPILFGFFNLLTPKSVHTLHDAGAGHLRRQAARDAVVLAAIMACFCAVLALFGSQLLELFFPRADYQAGAGLLVVLGLASLAASVGVPASIGLAAGERVKVVAAITSATAVASLALTAVALSSWGLLGGAIVLLVSETIGSLARWVAFLRLPATIPGAADELSAPSQSGRPT